MSLVPRSGVIKFCGLLTASLLVLVLLGCEEEVAAVDPTGYPFEVYGLFDPTADTQWVRVFPIEGLLRQNSGDPLNARVASTQIRAGEERVWNDSLVAYPDGSYGYLFWAPFRAEGGRTYRLDVARSPGAGVSATVAVPSLPHVVPYDDQAPVTLRASFFGEDLNVRAFEVDYTVRHGWCPYQVQTITYDYSDAVVPGWGQHYVQIEFGRAFAEMRSEITREGGFTAAYGLLLEDVEMRLEVTNGAWTPPGGTFDPDVLVQPGTMSNVENGFGFIAGGYLLEEDLVVSDDLQSAAGYTLDEPESPIDLDCSRGSQ